MLLYIVVLCVKHIQNLGAKSYNVHIAPDHFCATWAILGALWAILGAIWAPAGRQGAPKIDLFGPKSHQKLKK